MATTRYILQIHCPDQKGLIAGTTQVLAKAGANIIDLQQHTAKDIETFFLRAVFDMESEDIQEVYKHLETLFSCIVGNHPDLGPVGGTFGVPFYYVPSNPDKSIPENRFREIIAETRTDTVVLARYMQILSEAFTEEFKYRIINIHHGFLPAFKGAKPYHQAWHKGVKIIGATAHFATEDLDQGPIICQDIQRVPETASIDELVELGKDIEKRTLSQALKLWLEHRVFVYAGRTFIL